MSRFPIHRSLQLTEFGVYLKTVAFRTSTPSERYAFSHTDDYYFFGFIEDGQCRLNIDFEEYTFGKGSLAIIRPGQVHRIIDAFNLSAKFLVIDSVLVDKEEKRTLERYGRPQIQLSDISEQKLLLSLLDCKLSGMENPSAKAVVQRLTTVIVGLVVENIVNVTIAQSKLQGTVTVAYLNEAVNSVLGTSVSHHIQNEIILLAKRQLVYTTDSIKEIAHSLGFNDYSYFTRLFTKVAGVSPALFRRTYHE